MLIDLHRPEADLGVCRRGGGTSTPCERAATVEAAGVPLCELHADEYSLYELVGDLAQAQSLLSEWGRRARDLRNEPLAEALERTSADLSRRFSAAARDLKRARAV
jgi:hypothetical protein